MRYDFTPLYRSTVGFDRLFDAFDQLSQNEGSTGWPPYDIERLDENAYRISVVVAGFGPEEVELIQKENELLIGGRKKAPEGATQYLHRGIPNTFKQSFNLAEHVKVQDATLENGVLTVALRREIPEALKPRKIEISKRASPQTVVQDNTAQPEQLARRDQAA